MSEWGELGGALSVLVVPRSGRLESTGDEHEPYRLIGADGQVAEPVLVFLRDLRAAGKSAATLRSYAVDLLRWWRFLDAVGVGWDRASRAEAPGFQLLDSADRQAAAADLQASGGALVEPGGRGARSGDRQA